MKSEILEITKNLRDKPNRFSQAPYLEEKEGNYRSVSKWYYKIIYKVTASEVYILDIFHARKHPSEIEKHPHWY